MCSPPDSLPTLEFDPVDQEQLLVGELRPWEFDAVSMKDLAARVREERVSNQT